MEQEIQVFMKVSACNTPELIDILRTRKIGLHLELQDWEPHQGIKTFRLPARENVRLLRTRGKQPWKGFNLVRGIIVPFPNKKSNQEAYRLDFFDPSTMGIVAYASPHQGDLFARKLMDQGIMGVEKISHGGYYPGENLDDAVIGAFDIFDYETTQGRGRLANYKGKNLIVITTPGALKQDAKFRMAEARVS